MLAEREKEIEALKAQHHADSAAPAFAAASDNIAEVERLKAQVTRLEAYVHASAASAASSAGAAPPSVDGPLGAVLSTHQALAHAADSVRVQLHRDTSAAFCPFFFLFF